MNPAGYFIWSTNFACQPIAFWSDSNSFGVENYHHGKVLKTYEIDSEHVGKSHEELVELYPCPEMVSV